MYSHSRLVGTTHSRLDSLRSKFQTYSKCLLKDTRVLIRDVKKPKVLKFLFSLFLLSL